MAVEPLFTGTAAAAAVFLPPVIMRLFKANGVVAFLVTVISANVISEIVFRWAQPDFHYGPLFGLAVVMNVVITLILAGLAVAVTAIVSDWVKFQNE